jgi:Transposase domain (DUF772)
LSNGLWAQSPQCRPRPETIAWSRCWFYGLNIEDKIPDHLTFSRARNERYGESYIFRQVFERAAVAALQSNWLAMKGLQLMSTLIARMMRERISVGLVFFVF